MSRVEILNDASLRSDARRPQELRNVEIILHQLPAADGSAQISHGLTQVHAAVFGPREAKNRSQTLFDRAVINVEIAIAPFSSGERRKRTRGDKRLQEYAATIKATFEPVIHTNLYPRSQIDIYINVLQQDGAILQACINATTLALIDAGIPLSDFVCAITAGVYSTTPLLDLTLLEENDIPHLTLAVMPRSQKVTMCTMETRLHVDRFEEVFRLASEAGLVLHSEMNAAIRARTKVVVNALHSVDQSEVKHDDDDPMDGY